MGIITSFIDVYRRKRKPKSFKKGEKFEHYTKSFFPPSYYTLLEETPCYETTSKQYNVAALKPDFKFCDKKTNRCFYVESKYRSDLFMGKLEWCKDFAQLHRYQQYDRELPVFILIGLQGRPSCPDFVCLIPLSAIKYTGLFPSVFEKYEVEFEGRITSRELWNR